MKVQELPLDKLIPYARNPRQGAAIEKVAASLKEFSWRQPIVVDAEYVIIAGHTRFEAAKRLGLKVAPVHVAEGLSKAQVKAYRIADNRVAQEAEWDVDLLKLELEDLKELELDLDLTGFEASEIESLQGEATEETKGEASGRGVLSQRFGYPPFSVLNAREGWWQERKRAWIALGIKSEIGRGELANDRGESTSARINDAADGQKRYSRKQTGKT